MIATFEVRPIQTDMLRQAHSVLQLGVPELSLEACRRLCARGRDGRPKPGALMGVFDRRGYIHAVFRIRVEPVLPRGNRLKVYDLVLADLVVEVQSAALVAALEGLARAERCETLTIATPLGDASHRAPLPDALRARGFIDHGLLLARTL